MSDEPSFGRVAAEVFLLVVRTIELTLDAAEINDVTERQRIAEEVTAELEGRGKR